MAKDWDQQPDLNDLEFSLDEILAEFSSSRGREEGLAAPRHRIPVTRERRPQPRPEPPVRSARERTAERGPTPGKEKIIRFPGAQKEPRPTPDDTADIRAPYPDEEDTPLSRFRRWLDEFSYHMFEHAEPTQEEQKAERYMPGVDEEHAPRRSARRPRRRHTRLWPDTSPQELAARYSKGLDSLRVRRFLVFFLLIPLLYLYLAPSVGLPLPGVLSGYHVLLWVCAGLHAVALGLSYDLIYAGLTHLGADTLTVLAAFAVLADTCTLPFRSTRAGSLPYTLVSVLALGLGLWSRYSKHLSLRISCRTAYAAKTPYLVTLDEDKWDGRAVFSKWSGTAEGFGSQIQADDGAHRLFRPLAGVLILACILFSLLASVGKGRPDLFLWCLSTMLCAAAAFSGPMAFWLPFRLLSRRLAGVGAALAGWEGIRRQTRSAGVLLTDTDLFPPGAVALNGVKVFLNHPLDKVIAVTATMIRDTGSGLSPIFHELLHGQGAVYRKAEDLHCYEGGASAVIRGEDILVGNAAFMHMMEVPMPQDMNVKNAVFCAIDGELAGIFALNYALHATVRPSLAALLENKISPILVSRDFNLIPAMLHHRFKLPAEKMEFPEQDRRRALSDPEQPHDRPLVCVLCREGIGPLAETVVGAKRLCRATRINAALAAAGAIIGVLIAFYLAAQAAFTSLSVFNLLVFSLMWLVPTLLVSGWVNRY